MTVRILVFFNCSIKSLKFIVLILICLQFIFHTFLRIFRFCFVNSDKFCIFYRVLLSLMSISVNFIFLYIFSILSIFFNVITCTFCQLFQFCPDFRFSLIFVDFSYFVDYLPVFCRYLSTK